jgi:hypothetical protein
VQLAARDDARMVEVGPVQEISAPGEPVLYVTGDGVPAPPPGEVYRVWLVDDGQPRYVGDFLPEAGHVFLEIAYDPAPMRRRVATGGRPTRRRPEAAAG